MDAETGETGEEKLVQASGDAERFYRQLAAPALIGTEATGTATGWWICAGNWDTSCVWLVKTPDCPEIF